MTMTTIKFLGLLILTNLSGSSAHIVMGHVPGVTSHDAIIAWRQGDLVSQSNWPTAGSFVSGGMTFDYVRVGKENITFSGPTDAFANDIREMPHLSCCCPTMRGLKPIYGNPDEPTASKAAAHFTIDRGLFFSVPQPDQAIGMLLALTEDKQLTVTGKIGAMTRQLVLKFGANMIIANTPIAALEGKHVATGDVPDFAAYYAMGIDSASCNATPENPPCAPRATACSTLPTALRAPRTAKIKKLETAAIARCTGCLVGDINCSSSQWP